LAVDSLVRMANQIAANCRHLPPPQDVAGVATHLRSFWAPSMRAELADWLAAGGEGLDPLAAEAVRTVAGAPPPSGLHDDADPRHDAESADR
jgi:formate dehydrogenase subunit delta